MNLRITSKEITGLDATSYDLTNPGHFKAFIQKLEEVFDRKKEFSIREITEKDVYFHNLNHH